MGILKKYKTNTRALNQKVTKEDVSLEIQDLVKDIEYIEKTHSTILFGDRAHLNEAYIDCQHMTKSACAHFFSVWRSGIFKRYNML